MNADQLTTLLDQLSQRLSGPAAAVFGYAVRAQITEAVIQLAVVAFVLLAIGLALRWARRRDWNSGYSSDDELVKTFGVLIIGLGLVIAVVLAAISVQILLNPEWAALSAIVGR